MKPAIQCEFQLMNWGESATSGAWVKFWMNPEDLDAFRAVQCRSGKNAGQRFMGALVEIGDDEQPVSYQTETQPEAPKGGELARLAGMWCNSAKFKDFVNDHFGIMNPTQQDVANLIRHECGVESRADLDHNPEAAEMFHRLFRLPYKEWLQEEREGS